jgi:hypothetical protein
MIEGTEGGFEFSHDLRPEPGRAAAAGGGIDDDEGRSHAVGSEVGEPDVEQGTFPAADDGERLGDRRAQFVRVLDRAAEGAGDSRGDGGVVRRRIEAEVEVTGLAGITLRVDGKAENFGAFQPRLL